MKKSHAVFSFVLLTVLLTAGAAQSLSGSNTVYSDDIVNGQVHYADIRDGAVGSKKILDNSVTDADVANPVWTPLACTSNASCTPRDDSDLPALIGKDASGIVHMTGSLQFTLGGNIATLPAGYRPAKRVVFPTRATNQDCPVRLDVYPTGELWLDHSCPVGVGDWNFDLSLAGMEFYGAR